MKIDNHPLARPQWGINQADVVFEELVEGNITRFAAIFHSRNVTDIGQCAQREQVISICFLTSTLRCSVTLVEIRP